jgi:hypothetical protein
MTSPGYVPKMVAIQMDDKEQEDENGTRPRQLPRLSVLIHLHFC